MPDGSTRGLEDCGENGGVGSNFIFHVLDVFCNFDIGDDSVEEVKGLMFEVSTYHIHTGSCAMSHLKLLRIHNIFPRH